MTIVFADKQTADTVCKSILCTPSGIWLWYSPDSDTNNIQYCASQDGRQAISYPFDDTDAAWLTERLRGAAGVQIAHGLPNDWVWPENAY